MTFTAANIRVAGIPERDGFGVTMLVDRVVGSIYAPTTSVSMLSKMRKFYAFLTRHQLWVHDWDGTNLRVPDVTLSLLVYYIAFLCQTLSPQGHLRTTCGSVCQCVSALRTWARANDRPDPALDFSTRLPHVRYLQFCKGTKRLLGGKAMTRIPLASAKLRQMGRSFLLGAIVQGPVVHDMVAALYLAFWALLRVSENTVPDRNTWFDATVHATRGDVIFVPNVEAPLCMTHTVKVSKTDQFRVGHDLVMYPSSDPSFCPLAAMRSLFFHDPQPASAPLFDFTVRPANPPGRPRSMARDLYVKLFNRVVTSVGLDLSSTMTHSLRSGGATAMLRAGVATHVVTRLGRWKSDCWTRYVWATHALVQQAHRLLGSFSTGTEPIDFEAVRRD